MSNFQLPTSETINLKEFIEYANDSIVSKTLVQNDSGTITLFAFDDGQGLSEHTAPFNALVQVLEGKAEISIDRKPYEVVAGEVILMPADIPHAVKSLGRFKMLLTMLKSVK